LDKNQLVTVETTGVSMDTSKQQTSPRIPQCYIIGQPDKNRSSPSREEELELRGEIRKLEDSRKVRRNNVRTAEDRLEELTVVVQSEWSQP
jgi:hypothetical protein